MKHIEDTWPEKFKNEVRILRLSIAMDGVNPYSLQNTNYSIWLVVVINNNIPRWLCVKNEHLMLAVIVLGRRQVKNMDVYLQPLRDELKESWDGTHRNREDFYIIWHMCLHDRSLSMLRIFLS